MPAKLYGVSFGNGNDGVSHIFADYYVRTDDPWTLARAAQISTFKPGKGKNWCVNHLDVDGEAEYTISATLLNPPCDETEDGEYPDVYVCESCGAEADEGGECGACHEGHLVEKDPDDYEDGRNWSAGNGAWSIIEVFPADDGDTRDKPVYDSLDGCFDAADLELARKL